MGVHGRRLKSLRGFPPSDELTLGELASRYDELRLVVAELYDDRSHPDLTASEALIARAVRDAPGVVSKEALYELLYSARADDAPAITIISRFVTSINSKARNWSVRGYGSRRRFVGYFMTPEDKAAFDAAAPARPSVDDVIEQRRKVKP